MRIALIADTHLCPAGPAFDINLDIVRRWIAAEAIEHTIHLGDLSADGAQEPDQLAYARDRLAGWPGSLHVLPGNHDVGDNHRGTAHPAADRDRVERHVSVFGPDRWCIRVAGWTLVGLDAQLFGRGDALEREQDEWLAEALHGVAGPSGLFLHKPLCRTAIDDGDTHHRYVPPAAREPLLARFDQADLRFVVAGHTHQARRHDIGSVEHVWVPSTSFTLPDSMQETIGVKEVALMVLTLAGDEHRFERTVPAGLGQHSLADQAQVYPAQADAIRAAANASR